MWRFEVLFNDHAQKFLRDDKKIKIMRWIALDYRDAFGCSTSNVSDIELDGMVEWGTMVVLSMKKPLQWFYSGYSGFNPLEPC